MNDMTHLRVKKSKISDSIWEKVVLALTILSAVVVIFIFLFILQKSIRIFKENGLGFITRTGFDQQINDAFNAPGDSPVWKFGAFGLLAGTILTTLGALIIAVPMGIGTAVVITELAPSWIKALLQSTVRLLASIPSVIFGLLGLMLVVPAIQKLFVTPALQIEYIRIFQMDGKSLLAGILVLSLMILPIITALSVDAIYAVPVKYKEAALALGLSHWRAIQLVILPAATSGIMAGVVLGMGRAVGEAIALNMVTGGLGLVPDPSHGLSFFLTPVMPLAAAIVKKAEAMSVPSIEAALFAAGVVLMVATTILSLSTRLVEYLVKRRQGLV
ncbi:MAG: phosphate ABC transporter permease subunit PstC [Clostridiales bacterium]|nr:phosphate ABC transporter permease subunit PstC [Clostridiales bacterium]